ncbi:MAG: TIGR03936 family radical SAM-associated protein [Acidimicrobiales bacterium]|nr:TIGR03936 family radical SAM-associated protein [Acidimicrobiales bacterium]
MKLRIRYQKLGKVRFTSHRDAARIWERAIRRTGFPVAYSEGFSPRPRLSFGLALSTGHESLADYLDITVDPERAADVELADLPERLTRALPVGMVCDAAITLPPGAVSLQEAVSSCSWEIHVAEDADTVAGWIGRVLDAPTLIVTRERKGKPVTEDLRPSIRALAVGGEPHGGTRLIAELATSPRALRPTELLDLGEPRLTEGLIRRTAQWIESEGRRLQPLEVVAPAAPRTEVCAS